MKSFEKHTVRIAWAMAALAAGGLIIAGFQAKIMWDQAAVVERQLALLEADSVIEFRKEKHRLEEWLNTKKAVVFETDCIYSMILVGYAPSKDSDETIYLTGAEATKFMDLLSTWNKDLLPEIFWDEGVNIEAERERCATIVDSYLAADAALNEHLSPKLPEE